MMKSLYSKRAISESFSKAALSYDEFSHIQKLSNEQLLKYVPEGFYENVFEVGVGTGEFTRLLNKKIRFNTYIGIDISPAMLLRAKNSMPLHQNTYFICCDGEHLSLNNNFKADIIVSSSSMHWFHNLINSILYLKNYHLKKHGIMICSIFGRNSLKELQKVVCEFRKEQILLPTFFFPNEPILQEGLNQAFQKISFKKIIIKKAYPHLIDLLISLKKTGVAPSDNKSHVIFRTREAINKADKLYRDLFGDIIVSFEIFFFFACA